METVMKSKDIEVVSVWTAVINFFCWPWGISTQMQLQQWAKVSEEVWECGCVRETVWERLCAFVWVRKGRETRFSVKSVERGGIVETQEVNWRNFLEGDEKWTETKTAKSFHLKNGEKPTCRIRQIIS